MRSERRRLLGLGGAAVLAVTIPAPGALAGQDTQDEPEDCGSALVLFGASADEILAVMGSDPERMPEGRNYEKELVIAGRQARRFLSQFSGCRRSPGEFGPRPRAELDAFADRLVALATADPKGEATFEIVVALLNAGRANQRKNNVPYPGAWDALRRMYLGGAAMLSDLIALDPQRTIDWGLRLVQVGGLEEAESCELLGHALQHGKIHTGAGEMSFELAETTNNVYEKGVWGFKRMQQELAAELHAKGLIRTEEAPCQGFAYTHAVPYEIIEMVPLDSVPATGKRRGKGGE